MGQGQVTITEELLLALNFKKREVSTEESGDNQDYYYYMLELSSNNNLTLITNTSTEENFPKIHIMEVPDYEFTSLEPIIVLMNILEDNLINKEN